MTTNEIITELIRYDDDGDSLLLKTLNQSERMSYLTDLNILHRVAVKVWGKLIGSDIEDRAELRKSLELIENSFMYPPNEQGEYTHFATATAEAIIYLKSIKNSNTYLQ